MLPSFIVLLGVMIWVGFERMATPVTVVMKSAGIETC